MIADDFNNKNSNKYANREPTLEEMAESYKNCWYEAQTYIQEFQERAAFWETKASCLLDDYDGVLLEINALEKRIKHLKDCHDIQCSPGNYDVDEYMRGMANGLILALHIMTDDQTPIKYKEPKQHG